MFSMNKNDLLLEKVKLASELHRHEDTLVWARFSHFLTFMGILISGLGLLQTSILPSLQGKGKAISIAISAFGVLTSVIFSLIFLKSKKIQRYRVEQAKEAGRALAIDGEQVLDVYNLELDEQKLVPVSSLSLISTYKLMLVLSLFMTLIWTILLFIFIC
jgi:hypothetical protein